MKSRQLNGLRRGRSKTVVTVAAIAAFGMLGSGCSLEGLDPRSAEPEGRLDSPPSPPPELERLATERPAGSPSASVSGLWEGTYTCNQGLTRLNLTLTQLSTGRVTGIFRFSPDPSNPDVPRGSYSVRGTVVGNTVRLSGNSWISRPDNYEMVSLTGRLSSANPDQMQGTIGTPECSTFTVQRR